MKCKCKKDINIAQADINVRKNTIDITITREPDTPLISELRKQIAELQELGLKFQDIDRKIAEALSSFDIATKAYLAEVLTEYAKSTDLDSLRLEIKEWADSRFLRKIYLSQDAYDALEEHEENVMYIILTNE